MGRPFERAGARYAVLTTKHHDGYSLWPTSVPHPHRDNWHSPRDLVGELAGAVRGRGLRFGTYYSGGYDWSWFPEVIDGAGNAHTMRFWQDEPSSRISMPNGELIDRYETGLSERHRRSRGQDIPRLFRDYLARAPDGVIDNRFRQCDAEGKIVNFTAYRFHDARVRIGVGNQRHPLNRAGASATPSATTRWKTNRLSSALRELIHFFADLVSKNGNLLLNIGPMADGTIPPGQISRWKRWATGSRTTVTRSTDHVRGSGLKARPLTAGACALPRVRTGRCTRSSFLLLSLVNWC
ncbi:MAG: alpha-L-fucosidase [Thermomicrobiales bacterium]